MPSSVSSWPTVAFERLIGADGGPAPGAADAAPAAATAAPRRGTTTCCPSCSGAARLTAVGSPRRDIPPAASTAAATREPAGTRWIPGRATSPSTSTTREPAAGLCSGDCEAPVETATGGDPPPPWCSNRAARNTATNAASAQPASSSLRLSSMRRSYAAARYVTARAGEKFATGGLRVDVNRVDDELVDPEAAVVALERLEEDLDHARVELSPRAARELRTRLLDRQRGAVDAVDRHRLVGVGDGEDARLERDLVADEPVRVAAAVGTLVVRDDPRGDVLHVGPVHDQRAHLGVLLHLLEFV